MAPRARVTVDTAVVFTGFTGVAFCADADGDMMASGGDLSKCLGTWCDFTDVYFIFEDATWAADDLRLRLSVSCAVASFASFSSQKDGILTLGPASLFGRLVTEVARVFGPTISGGMTIDDDESSC